MEIGQLFLFVQFKSKMITHAECCSDPINISLFMYTQTVLLFLWQMGLEGRVSMGTGFKEICSTGAIEYIGALEPCLDLLDYIFQKDSLFV